MKTKILTKIALSTMIVAPSCAVERGVIIERQGLPEENALYVNLIKNDKSAQKPLCVQANGLFDADRKLFFMDSTYIEPFVYALPGDTIAYRNVGGNRYLYMSKKNKIHSINGVKNREIIKQIRQIKSSKQR